ncbi:MAG: protein-glutamate O-methyltransferase CheR [Planctomycetota bacterium]
MTTPDSMISAGAPNQQVLQRIRTLTKQWCGVHLDASKDYLIQNRLKELMLDLKVDGIERLIDLASKSSGMSIRDRVVDALTTHETLFFRDRSPFEAIKSQIIPPIKAAAGSARPRLRIWSAACSTGQEPYSLAILLTESLPDIKNWNITIEATDVSAPAVKQATKGEYLDHELSRGLTADQRQRFFTKKAERWVINDSLRRMVRFRVGNLLTGSPSPNKFDLILCRNVAIYFTPEDRLMMFEKLAGQLDEKGYLFVGCSEVLTNLGHVLKAGTVGRASCYRPVVGSSSPRSVSRPSSLVSTSPSLRSASNGRGAKPSALPRSTAGSSSRPFIWPPKGDVSSTRPSSAGS